METGGKPSEKVSEKKPRMTKRAFVFVVRKKLRSIRLCLTALTVSFESTIREAKAMSFKQRIYRGDSEREEHTIVFFKGEIVDIICSKVKTRVGEGQYGKT